MKQNSTVLANAVKRTWVRLALTSGSVVLFSQVYFSTIGDGFRISATPVIYPILLIRLGSDRRCPLAGAVTFLTVLIVRCIIACMQGSALPAALLQEYHGGLFYFCYRRVTFKRTNSAPTISGQDKALGLKNGSFAENYTVSDVEGDNVVVTEFVDDVQIRSYQATLGQQETIELTREKWLSLTNGQHQLRIEAVDGNFATSVRVFSFSKKETVIKFELVAPEETDAAATKVLVTPTWKIEGAVAKVEACNNGFDAVPTWEDITAMVQINRVYNFTNKTKTASKWGVNIRFTITKNEGFEGEVSISGFGGAYE